MSIETLVNAAEVEGILDGRSTGETSAVTVYMVDGLTMTKVADQTSWSSGPLTYTVTIDNQSGFDYTEVIFTDTLDPTLVSLILDSVYLGTTQLIENDGFTYNPTTGLLTIDTTPKISVSDGESVVLSFQVSKV